MRAKSPLSGTRDRLDEPNFFRDDQPSRAWWGLNLYRAVAALG